MFAILTIGISILIVLSPAIFPLGVCLVVLLWVITYLGICSIEVLMLVFVLGVNLFLLGRFDNKYSLIAGGIRFKLSFFIMAFVLFMLFLKIWASNVISKNYKSTSLPLKKVLALLFVGLVSTYFNRENHEGVLDSLYALLYFVIPIFYVYLIPRLNLNRFQLIFLAKFFVIIGLTISLLVIILSFNTDLAMQTLSLQTFGRRAIGWDFARISLSFGSANAIGTILLINLPLCVSFYLIERRVFLKSLFMSTSILLAVGSLSTLSRTSAIVLCVLVLGFLLSARHHSFAIKKYILLALMFISITVLLLSFNFSRYRRIEGSLSRRVENVKTSMMIAMDHILLGVGPNNIFQRMDLIWPNIVQQKKHIGWQKTLEEYKSAYYKGYRTCLDPHNVYIMILAELGLFGLLAFLFIVVDIIKSILNTTKRDFIGMYEKQILRGMLWGIIGFLIECLTGSYLVNNYKVAVFFWTYAGTALAISSLHQNKLTTLQVTSEASKAR
ncbi:MAG: hypothetical protein B5M53_11085 [Candidatus Cloacimonas sp. 4484_209]|nr:MAG: hypothetical protein B5M53_11085 [Candidatus Cloacimonas sp. 4484_209]